MDSRLLLSELTKITQQNLSEIELFEKCTLAQLNTKETEQSWSILECIEHLNRYGNFYIPELTQQLNAAKQAFAPQFKPGLLGDYFAKCMLPKTKLNKMRTFTSMNPNQSKLDTSTLTQFKTQQMALLEILEVCTTKNINKVKTSISISKWIKLKIGDTLRVVIYHNLRHIVQAKKVHAKLV